VPGDRTLGESTSVACRVRSTQFREPSFSPWKYRWEHGASICAHLGMYDALNNAD